MKKEIIIDGHNFSSPDEFYNEIERVLTKGLDWKIGRNLDAFNDILRGGFGVTEYEEAFKLIWKNSQKSKKDLALVINQQRQTFYDKIVEIIKSHSGIELVLI